MACTVLILWTISIAIQTIFPKHPAPDSVNQVMIIVATSFFGGSVISAARRKNGGDEDDEK